jgi:hypothetical protein
MPTTKGPVKRRYINPSTLDIADLLSANAPRFASVKYRAKGTGELARHSVTVGMNLAEVYKRDIRKLGDYLDDLRDQGVIHRPQYRLTVRAAMEIAQSLSLSLARWQQGQWNDDYTHARVRQDVDGMPGLWISSKSGKLYIQAFVRRKVVLEPGEYKSVNSGDVVIEKNRLKKVFNLGHAKIRTFCIGNIREVRSLGRVLYIDGDDT